MSIKIQRYVNAPPTCKDENTGKQCINNGKICRCNIYAGDLAFKNNFQARD